MMILETRNLKLAASYLLALLLPLEVMAEPAAISPVLFSKDDARKYFERDAVYQITNDAHGETLALTFVLPESASATTFNFSESSVRLMKPKKDDRLQIWAPNFRGTGGGNEKTFLLYTRHNPEEYNDLTWVMQVWKFEAEFSGPENDDFHDKYNKIVLGMHVGETKELWFVEKLANGKFRISSYFGFPDGESAKGSTKWNESRSLEAYKGSDGHIRLRHAESSSSPAQQWTFTKVGYFTPKK